jgi:hypothetical protein
MTGFFDDPRKNFMNRLAQLVISESDIRKAIQHSNRIRLAAKFINVSEHRFKHWANKYLDADTGLTLLELQRKSRLLEKANKVGTGPRGVKVNNLPNLKLNIPEHKIRETAAISHSNKEAADNLQISAYAWKKYSSLVIDEETGMNIYEVLYEKWRKISYERFLIKKESGWIDKYKKRKEAFEKARFKPGHQIAEEHKFKGLQLSEEVIRTAMKNTRSNKEAASWLRISYKTWKKYAKSYIDPITGRDLFSVHTASGGKGIPKVMKSAKNKVNPRALELGYQLIKGQYCTPARVDELSKRLMKDGRLGYCCAECGFSQKRPIDLKMPLMLNFKNDDRTDWTEDNLRWLCYNCSFLLSLDSFTRTNRQIIQSIAPESPDAPEVLESFYQIDDFYLDHLRNLGVKDLAEEVKPQKNKTPEDINDLIDYQ